MTVKFKRAQSRYQPGDIATFTPAMEQRLVEEGFADSLEATVEKKPPATTRQPDKPQTRQTTVGPQKR